MTYKRALELLKIERDCINRAATCDRQCEACDLVQETSELLEMYDFVIQSIERHRAKGRPINDMWDFEMQNVKLVGKEDTI